MFRIALKGVLARKGRLFLTALAVIMGTAFLAGSFIFTDTIRRTFDNLFADVYKDTDAYVRSPNVIEGDFGMETRGTIPESDVDRVEEVPGVAEAQPDVTGVAIIIKKDGDRIGGNGPPQFGSNYYSGELSPWNLSEGREPQADNEVVFDQASFDDSGYAIGDTVRIASVNGSQEFTLVGAVKFGDVDSPGGATFALFNLDTAQQFLLPATTEGGVQDQVSAVVVKGDGSMNDAELADAIQAHLGEGSEVLTGKEITEETQTDIRNALNFFTIFLTIFAFVALFVGSFVISNVFSITQAQRSRENALMRAIGASRRQVTLSMLVEAFFVGLIGSLLGLLGGIGLASGLKALLKAFGIDIPSTGLALLPRTVILTLVVGLIVTIGSAVLPALKAGRIPPVEALRDSAVERTDFSKRRLVAGTVIAGLGVVLIAVGLGGGSPIALAPGIPMTFIATYVLGPLIARPFSRLIGRPLVRIKGVTGHMARENAARNPKRTARTAAALLIGVALVTGVAVLAASIKASVRDIFGRQMTADLVIDSEDQTGVGGYSTSFSDEVADAPGVEAAAGISINLVTMGGDDAGVTLINPAQFGKVFDLDFVSGSVDDLTPDGILLSEDRAKKLDKAVGDTVDVELVDGSSHTLTVQGIYTKDELAGGQVVDRDLLAQAGLPVLDFNILILTQSGADATDVKATLTQMVDDYGFGKVQTRNEYIDSQAAQIDQFVNLVYGLLMLSVFIAAFGIIITLLLSVFERRRELALSRAVGMSKRQVRSMVRWEAVITSLLGTIQGIIVGGLLGFALVLALRGEGLKKFSLPIGTVIVVMVLAGILGVVAAIWPARRATRVSVVEAIATT